MSGAPAASRSVTFSRLAASFSSLAASHCCRSPLSCQVARQQPGSSRAGYTVMPSVSSITSRHRGWPSAQSMRFMSAPAVMHSRTARSYMAASRPVRVRCQVPHRRFEYLACARCAGVASPWGTAARNIRPLVPCRQPGRRSCEVPTGSRAALPSRCSRSHGIRCHSAQICPRRWHRRPVCEPTA
jgi:hypothetical protein